MEDFFCNKYEFCSQKSSMPVKPQGGLRRTRNMFVHWKSLLAFGILFWILLCAFDLFGGSQHGYAFDSKDYDLLYETFYMEKAKHDANQQFVPKFQTFAFSLLVWNSVTFLCSVLFCYVVRMFWWMFAKSFCNNRNNQILSALAIVSSGYPHCLPNISKIPVKVKSNNASDSQLKLSKTNLTSGGTSCTNFMALTSTDLSEESPTGTGKSQILFTDKEIPKRDTNVKIDTFIENQQLNQMRQEIMRIQNEALKEQTELSKKLCIANKDRKELSKQLATIQKENRAAKQQIEELAQDKMILVKKLETVNKEVKSNTKSKKLTLAKLEELSNSSENLKQQLLQVTRDKDILEGKLKVLQDEYERLQERIILNDDHICSTYQGSEPERDTDIVLEGNEKAAVKQKLETIHSVSETDLDMKKIQVKIKQLERNLENFNSHKADINFRIAEAEQAESDISLSMDESSQTEFKGNDDDDDKEVQDFYFPSNSSFSPRFPYWSSGITPYLRSQQNGVQISTCESQSLENVQDKLMLDVD